MENRHKDFTLCNTKKWDLIRYIRRLEKRIQKVRNITDDLEILKILNNADDGIIVKEKDIKELQEKM